MKTKTKKRIAGSILITTLVAIFWIPAIIWLFDKYLYVYVKDLVFPVQWTILMVIAGILAISNDWAVQVLIGKK